MAVFLSDFLNDEYNDLLAENGDWAIGLADNQYIAQIVDSAKGEWLFHPTSGVGIKRFLNGDISYAQVETLVTQELSKDGYTQIDMNINDEDLQTQLILSDELVLNIAAYR